MNFILHLLGRCEQFLQMSFVPVYPVKVLGLACIPRSHPTDNNAPKMAYLGPRSAVWLPGWTHFVTCHMALPNGVVTIGPASVCSSPPLAPLTATRQVACPSPFCSPLVFCLHRRAPSIAVQPGVRSVSCRRIATLHYNTYIHVCRN